MVGRLAYVLGLGRSTISTAPLLSRTCRNPARLGGIVPVSPPGYVSMLTDYIDAGQRFVTCPNQDTVYGAGFQRLDSKPVVVQVPDFGDRFFVYQLTDARTIRLPPSASSTAPSPDIICWLDHIGTAMSQKASTPSSAPPTDLAAVTCPGFSRTTRQRTRRPSSGS